MMNMPLEDLNALLQKIELSTQKANLTVAEEEGSSFKAYSPLLPDMLFFMNGGLTVSGMPISSQLYYSHVRHFVNDSVQGSASEFLMDTFRDFGFLTEEESESIKTPGTQMSTLYLMNASIKRVVQPYVLPFAAFLLSDVQGWTIAPFPRQREI